MGRSLVPDTGWEAASSNDNAAIKALGCEPPVHADVKPRRAAFRAPEAGFMLHRRIMFTLINANAEQQRES